MMTYMNEGKQYILLQAGSARRGQPSALVAFDPAMSVRHLSRSYEEGGTHLMC